MDMDSAPFEAAEPGHLPFGKLVYGGRKPKKHLVIAQFSKNILSYLLVFIPLSDKPLSMNSLREKSLDLLYKPLAREPLLKAAVYSGIALFPRHKGPDEKSPAGKAALCKPGLTGAGDIGFA